MSGVHPAHPFDLSRGLASEAAPPRVWIENVQPAVDAGAHPIKRCVGDRVQVQADLVVDGHDALAGRLLYRPAERAAWDHAWLTHLVNDRWQAAFTVEHIGVWHYTLEAWVDELATWRAGFVRKREAGQDLRVDLLVGARCLADVAERADEPTRARLRQVVDDLQHERGDLEQRIARILDPAWIDIARAHPDPAAIARHGQVLEVRVDPERAGFSAWYELFPRSWGEPGRHGSLRACAERLPYVQAMGFDVLYLPPIHPIGRTFRKGPNNALEVGPDDPGSPWAIGAAEGGHKAVHPELGTLEDFRWFVRRAREHGLEVALDIALQVSPDHPYVHEHPDWFITRPDGTIQYAENPPKKYQDIYPFDFHCRDWKALWHELASIFFFWIEQGVRIFRVDNPHTKPLSFWAWCIQEIKTAHPETIFLSEAFTRPKLMNALAKLGFSQSYTYFAWRNSKWELTEYMRELTETPVAEYFRPNFWPNTPDILTEALQFGGRPTFLNRLVLAATLSSNYGIYGPAFELMEHVARPGSGEYLDNEKYQLKAWDLDRPDSLRAVIARINRIRRENPALASNASLRFHPIENEAILCYSKRSGAGTEADNVILVVVSLDPHHTQSGFVDLDLNALGIDPGQTYQAHDLLSDARFLWSGSRAYVELNPHVLPAHVLRLKQRVRREQDFDYFG